LISGAFISGTFTPGFLDLSAYTGEKKVSERKIRATDLYVKSHTFIPQILKYR
jgi:hypothetical protein